MPRYVCWLSSSKNHSVASRARGPAGRGSDTIQSATGGPEASSTPSVRIGVVVGEPSGDALGAGLMKEIKRRVPGARFLGICGPQMRALGCEPIYAMDRISLLGFEELFHRLLDILRIRRTLIRRLVRWRADIFIGIDVPDFNIVVEARLKRRGIPTIHYVSPTVWAWRGYRIRKIARAVNHMLTLFPFEADFYRAHDVPVTFVGHPMADQIRDQSDAGAARRELGLPGDTTVIALLPGSRMSELRRLAPVFAHTARWLAARREDICFIVPAANERSYACLETVFGGPDAGMPAVTLLNGKARTAMTAADVVLLASGTAALEAALLRRPMVVAYRLSWFSYTLIRMLAHVKLYSMPNNLVGREIVPEFIQDEAQPDKLGAAIEAFLDDPEHVARLQAEFAKIHNLLKGNASAKAANAVVNLLQADT